MPLNEILQKNHKTTEDAQFIFEDIRKFRFFENFFAQNLKTLDTEAVLSLCQTFHHEHIPMGNFVFEKDDASNNKFYVILSGQVSIVLPKRKEDRKGSMTPNRPLHRMRAKMLTIVNNGDPLENLSDIDTPAHTDTNKYSREQSFTTKAQFLMNEFDSVHRPPSSIHNTNRDKKWRNTMFEGTSNKFFFDHVNEVAEHKTEHNTSGQHTNVSGFQECAIEAGNCVRRLNKGEAFGELALKNNEPRSASVFCNTDCEFLIITKEQFDLAFVKKDAEKEIFLKNNLPVFSSPSSSIKTNVLFYSFKTEAFSRDMYLTNEGKIADKEPRIFVIHQGECRIEKRLAVEVNNPYDRSTPITYKAESLHLAVVGKGAIIGEEILVNGEEYSYSVKAMSDTVIAYSLTKKELESGLFKEFSAYLIDMYETKRNQREIIYQNLKKEHEAKLPQYKEANLYYMKNSKMKHVINNSAIQGFSRYLHREQKISELKDVSVNDVSRPVDMSYTTKNSLFPIKLHRESQVMKRHANKLQTHTLSRDNFRVDRSLDFDDSKNQTLNNSNETVNKAPNLPKAHGYAPEPKDLEELRFFDCNPRKLHLHRNSHDKINGIVQSTKDSVVLKKPGKTQVDLLLKGIIKKAKKAKQFNQSLIDVKGAQKLETKEDHAPVEKPIKKIPILTESTLPDIVKVSDYKDRSPIGGSTGQHTMKFHRPSSTFSWASALSVKNMQMKEKYGESTIKNVNHTVGDGSFRDRHDSLKYRLTTFDSADGFDAYRRTPNNGGVAVNQSPDMINMCLNMDWDGANRSPSPNSRIISTGSPSSEMMKQVGMLTNPVNPRLHGLQVRHSTPLLNARDWREGIFKKVPRNNEVKVAPVHEISLGCKVRTRNKK